MVIYFTVLYLLPPPHVLYHLSWVLHQQQWTLGPTLRQTEKRILSFLPLPSLQKESAQAQSRYYRLASNPLPTSVFYRMLSSTNQREKISTQIVQLKSKNHQELLWKHTKPFYKDILLLKWSTVTLSRDNSLEISCTMKQNLWFWNRDNLFESSTSLRYPKGFSNLLMWHSK
jgi:hypothetical protein